LEMCDVVVRLLAASVVYSVCLDKRWGSADDGDVSISAPTLAYLMERCQSLKVLKLQGLQCLDENNCRVLGAYSRPGLKIELFTCTLTNAGSSALAEVLGRNQGPTKLVRCDIDYSVFANGLRGNSRLKSFSPHNSGNPEVGNQELLAIAGALRENRGLVDLDLSFCRLTDESWGAVCDSLKAHPALEVLDLRVSFTNATMTPTIITSRIQALFDMMKVNISIHTIHLNSRYSQQELFRTSVIPYLEANRFRPRVSAIQRTSPIAYRAKVLGRALLATRTSVNSFWMLLSGNAEVAFLSTTAAAANLTTPATAAGATSNVAPVVATVAATAAVTHAASTTTASAVDIATSPTATARQKRKAHPF
jgi:hypothetical protein